MCSNRISGFVPKLALSAKSSGFVPEFTLSAKSPGFVPEFTLLAKSQAQFLSPCSVGSIFELLLGWINFRALARSDQLPLRSVPEPLLGRINSRALAQSDQLQLQSVPEPLLGRINSRAPTRSDQLPLRSVPEPLLGRISSRSDQFPSPCSVGSILEPLLDVDLVVTSSCPRTTGPPTWPTRREKSVWRRYGGVSGCTADLAQVRSTPLTCRRTSHCKDGGRGREVRRHGKQ
ncbi:hypothetical protein BHM03_00054979 [Ensete ventricosum]|nr:hypothetical protein BHM03_00054979 [Ensete ventricosum]